MTKKVKIIIQNKFSFIRITDKFVVSQLDNLCSFHVMGHKFSKAYKSRKWDGCEHLMRFVPRKGYRIPTGLVWEVEKFFKEYEIAYEIINQKSCSDLKIKTSWNESIVLRDYQQAAIDKICSGESWEVGNGILKLPIRSGKTIVAAGIVERLKKRSLVIVPSLSLLYQTKSSIEGSLGCSVGIIGDSQWVTKEITIATIQTLSAAAGGNYKDGNRWVNKKPTEKFLALSEQFDVMIMDECHHASAPNWKDVLLELDCAYKIGLSATIFFDNESECEKGVIYVKASCGEIRYEVSTSYLIDKGYLMRQNVEIFKIKEPFNLMDKPWSKELQEALITKNYYRNAKIANLTAKKINNGSNVLIISNRMVQIKELKKLFNSLSIDYEVITGKTPSDKRAEKLQRFADGNVDLLIGSVLGEGIDLPRIETVINAEGGKDVKRSIQRMRNLGLYKSKTRATFVDFADLTNKYFARHTRERLSAYRSEPAFRIKIFE